MLHPVKINKNLKSRLQQGNPAYNQAIDERKSHHCDDNHLSIG